MFESQFTHDRIAAIRTAKEWQAANPLILDTETTGLRSNAEVVDLAIMDISGQVLFDHLIHPRNPIPPDAEAIHGITNEMVSDALPFSDYYPQLCELFKDRLILTYNSDYDVRMLYQAATYSGIMEPSFCWSRSDCLMKLYAQFYGDYNDYRGNYRWQRLTDAVSQCAIPCDLNAHRALADTEMARQVLLYMTAQPAEVVIPSYGGEDERR